MSHTWDFPIKFRTTRARASAFAAPDSNNGAGRGGEEEGAPAPEGMTGKATEKEQAQMETDEAIRKEEAEKGKAGGVGGAEGLAEPMPNGKPPPKKEGEEEETLPKLPEKSDRDERWRKFQDEVDQVIMRKTGKKSKRCLPPRPVPSMKGPQEVNVLSKRPMLPLCSRDVGECNYEIKDGELVRKEADDEPKAAGTNPAGGAPPQEGSLSGLFNMALLFPGGPGVGTQLRRMSTSSASSNLRRCRRRTSTTAARVLRKRPPTVLAARRSSSRLRSFL